MKDVDLGEPTSFLDHVHLGCTQRECRICKDIAHNYRSMLESRISAGATEKYQKPKATGKPDAETTSSWSNDMEGHAKKCVERYCELYLARIGRLDILWSVNKRARAVTKWTKACDKRLARLISYIHHTCDYRQYGYVANTAQQRRLEIISRL